MISTRRLGYALGARVSGLDLSAPLDEETVAEIRAALLEHVVLCFPGQRLSAEAMQAFCGRFGELDLNLQSPNRHPSYETVMLFANKPVEIGGGKQAGGLPPASHWHSDFSYVARPTSITFLLAERLPDVGGNTMFANQYLAYETLSPAFRAAIDPLLGIHDFCLGPTYARSTPEKQAAMRAANPPVAHRVVRTHPETGRKALYVGNRLRAFAGMTEEESQPLIAFLNAHAVRYEFLYRHAWTVGDLLMWDNRAAMHYAVQDYDQTQLRKMLRCSLLGPKTGDVYRELAAV